MQQNISRTALTTQITRGLAESPAVALLGARQVGKTTLAREITASWPGPATIFDLEVATDREALVRTPARLLGHREGLVVIDEVQRLPHLFETLRPVCDDPERKAVFLLLGSASWDLVMGVSESLAGRILFVDATGFSLEEVQPNSLDRLWMRGGFPRAWLALSADAWTRWMESFSRTFLERDIAGLGSTISPAALGRFWRMLAHVHGQTWNASRLARSMDTDARTVNRYRDLLEGAFMIRVLRPWFANLGKRLVKSPKVYLRDSGILHFLLGLEESHELAVHPAVWGQLGGLRPGADPDRPRSARRVFLRNPARGGTGPAPAAPGPTLGVRVQVHGNAPHHEVHARRHEGSRAGTSLGGLSRQP